MLTLDANPICGPAGRTVTFTGKLTDTNGNPIPGRTVLVGYSSNGHFVEEQWGNPTTDGTGSYTATSPTINNQAPIPVLAIAPGFGQISQIITLCPASTDNTQQTTTDKTKTQNQDTIVLPILGEVPLALAVGAGVIGGAIGLALLLGA